MQCLLVIIILISSVYSSDDVFSDEPSDNEEITTRVYYDMVGDISNKGRRYDSDDSTDIIEEVSKTEEDNPLTDETENPLPIPFPRNVRSFDFYDDLYDSYRRKNMKENKNNDPKNILNDIRSRNSQSNYNEDQQRRLFFSHIFSLFDDDKNTRRSAKSDEKNKHSKSHIDHEIETFKSLKATEQPTVQSKHDSNRKTSSKHKNMEPEYDTFESNIVTYLNDKRLPNKQYNEENESKHRKKNKGKRQTKRNNSRPERQLGDSESFEIVENQTQDDSVHHAVIANKMMKNRKRKITYNDEIFDSQRSYIKFATSTPVSEMYDEKDSSETAYLVRTPSFNYYQTDGTYVTADERSVKKEDDESITNITSADNNHNKDTDALEISDDKFNYTEQNEDIQDSVTFNPDVQSGKTYEHVESGSHEENIMANEDETVEREPLKVIVEELTNNQSHISASNTVNYLVGKHIRRMNYNRVNKDKDKEINKGNDISTIKEEIETPEQELQVTKVYGEAAVPNVRNPLSARITFDFVIQLPSQIDVGN